MSFSVFQILRGLPLKLSFLKQSLFGGNLLPRGNMFLSPCFCPFNPSLLSLESWTTPNFRHDPKPK